MKTLCTLITTLVCFSLYAQVSVKSYGAVGNGYTDDGPAIQRALNSGNSTVYFESGKVYVTSVVLTVPSNVTVIGNSATLKPNSYFTKSAFPVITTSNKTNYYQSGISIGIKKGSSSFSYSKASYLKVGSIIWLAGPQYITYGTLYYKRGWYGTITNISGYTVTLNTPATDNFTASSITQYVTTRNVKITGVNVNLKGRTTGFGVGLTHAVNSSISNCFVESDPTKTSAEVGINVVGVNLTVSNNKVRNIRIPSGGTGYGINAAGHYITIQGNDVAVARHCITSAERYFMSTNINVIKNKVNCGPGSAPIDFHGNTKGKIDGNTVYSNTPNIAGIMVRNSATIVSNNIIYMTNSSGTRVYGVAMSENGYNNITVTGNKVYIKGTSGGSGGVGIFSVSGTVNNLIIKKNYFQGYVSFSSTLGTGLRIDSNTFEGNTVYAAYVSLNSSTVKDYHIEGNTFLNKFDSRFNYTISTTTYSGASGYIRNNVIRCLNNLNTSIQIRINNKHNVVENNKIYCQSKTPLIDFTSDLQNWINNNKKINSSGVTTLITYTKMPYATSWFYNRKIYFTNSSGVTSQYTCVKTSTSTGSTTYVWSKQSSFVTKANRFKTPVPDFS
jgi:hypothetical protein